MTTGMAKVRDGELFYEVEGEGPPVVLLHGGVVHSGMWDPQFEFLAMSGYTAVRYDARGHGRSSTPTEDYALHEDLHYLLDHLGIARATLMGMSMGGATAIDFALTYPQMVEALVLAGPGISGTEFQDPFVVECHEGQRVAAKALDADAYVEWFLRLAVDGPYRSPEQVDPEIRRRCKGMAAQTVANHATAKGSFIELPATERVGELQAPILAMIGNLELPDIVGVVDLLESKAPEVKKVVFSGAGHMLNFEQKEEFNEVLLEFLSDVIRR